MNNHWAMPVLKLAAAITILFGIMIALVPYPSLAAPGMLFTDIVIWPIDGMQQFSSPEARLFAAVLGGVMVGWGLMQWLVITRLVAKDPGLARELILVSTIAWFVVDSTGSVLVGAPLNVLPNAGFLVMFVLPALALPKGA